MPTKRIACLAASLKHGGFCYAGKDIATGEWVRPVSDDKGHAIIRSRKHIPGTTAPGICHRRLVAEYLASHWPGVDIVHL